MKLKNISNYSQPDFYKFTEESLELVAFAQRQIPKEHTYRKVLDVCAGCGVIGIEALLKIKNIEKLTFLELQSEFLEHIQFNIEKVGFENFEIVNRAIGDSKLNSEKFDLVFSNPPYYLPGEGRESPNSKRQICRTFEVDGWSIYFENILNWLHQDSLFFFSVKSLSAIEKYLKKFEIINKEKTKSAWLVCLSRLDKN